MSKTIYFVTNNKYKLEIAQKALANSGVSIMQQKLDVPEIQSDSVEEIARFSACWAVEKIKQPIFVTDAGYYIQALNGFPGPFIKWTNKWFTAKNYLKLMEGKTNRKVKVLTCLAYCEPGKKPILFTSKSQGAISEKPGKTGTTPINEIFIPEGFTMPESEIDHQQMINFWGKTSVWQKFREFLGL